jgi:hypothetical protein
MEEVGRGGFAVGAGDADDEKVATGVGKNCRGEEGAGFFPEAVENCLAEKTGEFFEKKDFFKQRNQGFHRGVDLKIAQPKSVRSPCGG